MNAGAKNKKKFFTAEEANQRLPLVKAIVEDIVRLFEDVHERKERLARVRQLPGASSRDDTSVYAEELAQIEEELNKDIERLEEYREELLGLGAELEDYVTGLVDFPFLMDGREACLCWKLGEDEIAYWHEIDAGFKGRQSLFAKSADKKTPGEENT